MRYTCFPQLLFCSGIAIYSTILCLLVINTNNLSNRIDDIYKTNLFKQPIEKREKIEKGEKEKKNIYPSGLSSNKKDEKYEVEEDYNKELERTKMRVENLKNVVISFRDNMDNLLIDEHHNEEKFNIAIDIMYILHNFTLNEYDENKKKQNSINKRLNILEERTYLNTELIKKLKN
jgi:hypothetical protein